MSDGAGARTYKDDGILSAVVCLQPCMFNRGNLGSRMVVEVPGCARHMLVTMGFEYPERHGALLALFTLFALFALFAPMRSLLQ